MNEDKLDFLLRHNRQIRVIGFDDAPFVRHTTEPVAVAGVVCNLTRFEGMLWGHIQADGWESGERYFTRYSNFTRALASILDNFGS